MSGNKPRDSSLLDGPRTTSIVVLVVAILVGALLVPVAFGVGEDLQGPDGKVAVIDVPQLINGQTAEPIIENLREARQNESIEAVVLDVNSQGGGLGPSEELYLSVEQTAEEMPLAVHVETYAASGGYYVSLPAERIFANPSAIVGSIGVRMSTVASTGPSGQITSGPDKAGGMRQEEAIERAEYLVQGFYGAVEDHRGDEIELSQRELAHAKIYFSQEALHNGLIDEIGTTDTAIRYAADEAGLSNYEVVKLGGSSMGSTITLAGSEGERRRADAAALLAPALSDRTVVPLALYGTLPNERPIVTTAGQGVTVVDADDLADPADPPNPTNPGDETEVNGDA